MNIRDCPTPWQVRPNGFQIEDANGGLIAQTHSDAEQPGLLPHPQAMEIARLIAAAPDLLAACRNLLHMITINRCDDAGWWTEEDACVATQARSAIAQATGNKIPTPAVSENLNQPLAQ